MVVLHVPPATSMGGGGACQDMQSDVHCLRFSAVPDAVGYAMQVSMKGMAIKGNTALSHRASKCFPAISRAREPVALQTSRFPTCTRMRLSGHLLVDSPRVLSTLCHSLRYRLSYTARSWGPRPDVSRCATLIWMPVPPEEGLCLFGDRTRI